MALPVIPGNIPEELRAIDSWVAWKEREEKGKDGEKKIRKEPRDSQGKLVKWTQQDRLLPFKDAYSLYKNSSLDFDGVGFVLDGTSGIVGIDIDKSIDCSPIRDSTYTELSPGGNGIRAFGYAEGLDISKHPKGIGIFTKKRFLTVTGHRVSDVGHLGNCTRSITALLESIVTINFVKREGSSLSRERLNELLRENARFRKIWNFEAMDDYDSFSEADMSVAWHAVKAGWGDGEIAELLIEFRERGAGAGFDTKNKESRDDYIVTTIQKTRDRVNTETEAIPYLTLEQALDLPPIEWMLEGIIPRASVGMLWGAPSSGKTFAALDLVLRTISGKPWFDDRRIVYGDVLYILSEGVGDLSNRLAAWFRFHRDARAKHQIAIWTHAPQITNSSDMNDIRMFCERRLKKLRLIVFDTLSRSLVGQDENSNMIMSKVADQLTFLMKRTEASILILHHGTKPGEFASVARGGGALVGALDYSIESKRVYPAGDSRHRNPLRNIFELVPDKPPRGGAAFESFPIFLRRSGDGVTMDTNAILTGWLQHRRRMTYCLSADQFVALLEYRTLKFSSSTIERHMQKAGLAMSRDVIERTLEEMFPTRKPDHDSNHS